MTSPLSTRRLPVLDALDTFPLLRTSVEPSLSRQLARIAEHVARFRGRRAVLSELHTLVQTMGGGVIALEGPPGAGVTAVLARLAVTLPCAFWFAEDDSGGGAAALCAQLIALHRLPLPLVAPAASQDPMVLEQLLEEVAQQSAEAAPLILIDPLNDATQARDPFPMVLPFQIPPHVTVIYGCAPGAATPWPVRARIALPQTGELMQQDQVQVLRALNCPEGWHAPVLAAAQGNFLYLLLVVALLQRGRVDAAELPKGLEALHKVWWERCDATARRMALLLAAAGAALPATLCAELLGADPTHVEHGGWFVRREELYDEQPALLTFQLAHWATRDYLARRHAQALSQVHADFVNLTLRVGAKLEDGGMPSAAAEALPNSPSLSLDLHAYSYLRRQFARHAACGPAQVQTTVLPIVARRRWVRAQERRSDGIVGAARDLAWELKIAIESGPVLRLVRSAALAGALASRARVLSAETALAALEVAQQRSGRDSGLKRVLDLVEQLPEGRDKAHVLRRIGEACYDLRMRAVAMRLLSRALDLEEQPFPRAWREQREQLHAALAQATLDQGSVAGALEISARISHVERRGMAETQVVRRLLERGELADAGTLACTIAHESLGAWARAEVAVALARAGALTDAEAMLARVSVETAAAWAQIELACDAAATNEDAARARIEGLGSANQRDRGLARISHALAMADKDGDALAAAEQIGDVEVRVTALLDLRLQLQGLVAMLALEAATKATDGLNRDARVPLVAALAAAHAALGRRERALQIAEQLSEGEERDRALSRVAVAFARQGEHMQGQAIARTLADDDERDWALDELTRLLAGAGRWRDARDLAQEIKADDLRARTFAELAIARARTGNPLEALGLAVGISLPVERSRALILIAPALVVAGHTADALALAGDRKREIGEERSDTALPPLMSPTEVSRYRTAITIALAEADELEQAEALTDTIARPLDRARAYLAIARVAAPHDPARATAALGSALAMATLGREEAFRLLEQATPVLAILGGDALLTAIAAAVDEIDGW